MFLCEKETQLGCGKGGERGRRRTERTEQDAHARARTHTP